MSSIIMYLEDKYPQHPLLPTDIHKRAINFQVASIVSSSIQPLHNLNLLKYIEEKVGPDEKLPWVQSVIRKGFTGEIKLTCSPVGFERG
uniref:Glutathione S-transferase zeta class-like isoform X2 n=1 Tax=Cicer arietinum TaxID=3827 RepID=A0A1S3EJD3_CICAR|nr:glutathione S-transferase zeta class-like isoform X2 [Cicer arietinum]